MIPTTEVAKTQQNELAAIGGQINHAEDILNSDIVIPKLLLMQGTSEFVGERKAQQGDIVKSLTAETVGGPDQAINIIPITFRNSWRVEEIVAGKPEYRYTEARDSSNENAEWAFVSPEGKEMKRTKVLELFVLRPEDIDSEAAQNNQAQEEEDFIPDLDKVIMPYVISFRSTSFKVGQQIVSHFAKARSIKTPKYPMGVPAFAYTLNLSVITVTKDKNMWYSWKLNENTRSTKEQIKEATKWQGILSAQASSFVVDESADLPSTKTTDTITKDIDTTLTDESKF